MRLDYIPFDFLYKEEAITSWIGKRVKSRDSTAKLLRRYRKGIEWRHLGKGFYGARYSVGGGGYYFRIEED